MNPSIEHENPFLGRILAESAVAHNEHFRVVYDRDPAASQHLLLYSIRELASLADAPDGALNEFLENELTASVPNEDFFMIERGRSRFCSSFGNVVHAHAHLVPARLLKSEIALPRESTKVSTLDAAFEQLKDDGEYLLAGIVGKDFQFTRNLTFAPKRLARLIIEENRL